MKKAVCTSFLLFFTFFVFSQQSVFVKSSEIGNGILCERAGECFVITPLHVVEDTMGEMIVFNESKVKSIAKIEGEYDSDLAILSMVKNPNLSCTQLIISDYYSKSVNNLSSGTVEYLDESGVFNIIHVNITYKDNIGFTIIPQSGNTTFSKGMSGSSFYFNYKGEKVLAGMLMSIEEGFVEAFVLQIDDVMRVLSPFFEIKTGDSPVRNGPKKIGVMLLKDGKKESIITNQLVTGFNQEKTYKAFSKFPESKHIEEVFDDIILGSSDVMIPSKLSQELDEIFIGNITFTMNTNRKNMYNVYADFNGGVYSTKNFNLINSIIVSGKGLDFDESNAKKQAMKSLKNNIKNQFK